MGRGPEWPEWPTLLRRVHDHVRDGNASFWGGFASAQAVTKAGGGGCDIVEGDSSDPA